MATTWYFEQRDGYLVMVASGEADHHTGQTEEFDRYTSEIMELVKSSGCRSVLLDRRQIVYPPVALSSDLAIQSVANRLAGRGWAGVVHRAALLVRSERLPDTLFQEDVFQNRGVNARYFDDETAAVAWLLAE